MDIRAVPTITTNAFVPINSGSWSKTSGITMQFKKENRDRLTGKKILSLELEVLWGFESLQSS